MKRFKTMLILVAVTGILFGIIGCMSGMSDEPSSGSSYASDYDQTGGVDDKEDQEINEEEPDKEDENSSDPSSSENTDADEEEYPEMVDKGSGYRFKEVLEHVDDPENLSEMDLLYKRFDTPQQGKGDHPITEKEFNYSDYHGDKDQAIKDAFAYGESGSGWYMVENIRNPYDGLSDEVIVRVLDDIEE